MTGQKKGRPESSETTSTDLSEFSGTSTESQLIRLLAALEAGPMDTFEIRHRLDIPGVGPRIFDLRHKRGKNILMTWVLRHSDSGKLHRIALYSLLPDLQPDLFEETLQ